MKKLQLALLICATLNLSAQERKEIKKDRQCKVLKTWTEKDNNNQVFYYTKISVPDSVYPVYQLKVTKYETDNERHPLKDRIIQVVFYPDHQDNQYVNFFGCSTNSGQIERREDKYLYCYKDNKLLIIEQKNDSTFIPNTLVKEGQYDALVERYHYKTTKKK